MSSPPPSPEDGNRSRFRNIMFFGTQDDGKSPEKFCEFCTTLSMSYLPDIELEGKRDWASWENFPPC
jgi:hypothetical protein